MSDPKKFAFIDSIRGLAFLGVMFHHVVPQVANLPGPIIKIYHQTGYGVQLFFLASAMTLFMSLDSRTRSERYPTLFFFIRRAFRIIPLFYAGALFYTLINHEHPGLGAILSTLTFTHIWNPQWINLVVPGGWSIGVEMTFYLMVPFLFRKLHGIREAAICFIWSFLFGVCASIVIKKLLGKAGFSSESVELFAWFWLPTQLPIFFLGFTTYFVIKPILRNEIMRDRALAYALLATSFYIMLACTFGDVRFYFGIFGFGAAFVLLMWSLAIEPNPILVNWVTRYIGIVSYSAYMTHFLAIWIAVPTLERIQAGRAFSPLMNLGLLLALTLGITISLSMLTYHLIEVPGQRLGRWLIRRIETAAEARQEREVVPV